MAMEILIVFGTAILELWAAIPVGIGFRLHPGIIILVSSLGAFSGAFIVLILGAGIQKLILRVHRHSENKNTMINRIWQKYGVVGLGLLSPLLTGAPIGMAIGVLFQADNKKLLLCTTIGIIIWSIVLTITGHFGFKAAEYIFTF